jgi:hypothetical protein
MSTILEFQLLQGSPSLREHRVSMASFGPALTCLLPLVRRAAELALREHGVGHIRECSSQIDIEIAPIVANCAVLPCHIVHNPTIGENVLTVGMLDLFAMRAANDISAAGRGESDNRYAKKFVTLLPVGTNAKCHVVASNGMRTTFDLSVGASSRPVIERVRPIIMNESGRVGSICFDEGSESITFRSEASGTLKVHASKQQVMVARDLVYGHVEFTVVGNDKNWRLVRVSSNIERPNLSNDQLWDHIATKWNGTLKALAQ